MSAQENPDSGRRIASKLNRRIAYSLAAGASAGLAGSADAQISFTTFDALDGTRTVPIGQGLFDEFDIDGDGNFDFQAENFIFNADPDLDGNYTPFNYQGFYVEFAPGTTVGFFANGIGYASALEPGDLIDATTTAGSPADTSLAFDIVNPNAEFNDVDSAFIGLSFPIGPTNLHFGWVRVSIDNAAGEFTVLDAAYNTTPGEGIVAGQVTTAGDYNFDGLVNAADYTIARQEIAFPTGSLAADGDFDDFLALGMLPAGVNPIDLDDIAVWAANYGGDDTVTFLPGFAPAPSAAVPEPTSLGLLAAGVAGLAAMRRMRRPVQPLDLDAPPK